MKVIYNNIIPFSGFKACAIFPWVFVRNEYKERFTAIDSNHETIHLRQQTEMLVIFFLIWYGLEYVTRWIYYGFNHDKAYKNVSFEREAYNNQANMDYLRTRKHYAFLKLL